MAQLQSSSITGSLIISSSGTDSTTNSLLVTNGAGYEYLKVTDGGTVDVRQNLIINHATFSSRALRLSWGSIFATDTNNELILGSVYADSTATRIYISGKNSDNSPSDAISMQAGNGVAIFSGTNSNLFDPQALLHVSGAGIFTGDLDVTGSLHVLGDLTVGKISNQSELVDVGGNFNFDTVAEPTSAERTNFSSSIISSAGNVDNGTHYYHVIYKTSDGGETGAYGTPFLAATITDNTTAGQVELTGIPTSSDARVTARDIYRTEAGDNQYYSKKLATISDNTTTTYTDNLADSSLDQNTLFYRKANSTAGYFYKDNNLFAQAGNAHYTSFGVSALESVTIGQDNVAFGGSALQNTTSGRENTAIGYSSGVNNTTGYGNTYLGYVAGYFNETGIKNTAVGGFALRQATLTSANYNTAVGHGALWKLTGSNNHNTAIGHAAGQGYQGAYNVHIGSYTGYKSTEGSGGDYNINIGYYTGNDTTGDNNILIGRQLEAPNSGSSNQLNIGNLIYATGLGLSTTQGTGNVGIGTTSPVSKLDVVGDARATNFQVDSGNRYKIGNGSQYITGTNDTAVEIYSGGSSRLYVSSSGNVGINTTNPQYGNLHVEGDIFIKNNSYLKSKDGGSTIYNLIGVAGNGHVQVGQPNRALEFYGSSTLGQQGIWFYEGGDAIMLLKGGNVGIGTTSPGRKLTVAGTDNLLFLDSSGNSYITIDRSATNRRSALVFSTAGDGTSNIPDNINWALGTADSDEVGDGTGFFIGTNTAATSAKLFISSSGNVGVGTTSPVALLTLEGAVGGDPMLRLKSTGTATSEDAYMAFNRDNTNNQGYTIGLDSGDNSFKISEDGDSITTNNRLTILTGGNVGIGTNSPNAGLEVANAENSTLRLTRNSNTGNYLQLQGGSSGAVYNINTSGTQDHIFQTGGNEKMRLTSAGNVGIGTTSPSEKLQVNGNIAISGSNATLQLREGSAELYKFTAGGTSLDMTVNSTNALSIYQNGYVGIGTTSPDSPLEIYSDSTTDFLKLTSGGGLANPVKLIFEKTTAEQGIIEYNRNGDLEIYNTDGDGGVMINGRSSEAGDLYVADGGNVGIGTSTPTLNAGNMGIHIKAPTNVSSELRLDTTDSDRGNYLTFAKAGVDKWDIYSPADGSLRFRDKSLPEITTPLTLLDGGNVGIGTTSPSASLHVSGTADVMLIEGSGSTANTSIFAIDGNNGRLFEVSDDLSDSLFSVNTIAGLPVMEVFSDNRVTMGAFNQNDFVISGSKVGIGTDSPSYKLDVSGSINHAGASYIVPATTSGASGATTVLTGTTFDNATLIKASHDGVTTGNYTLELPSASSSTNRTIRIISDSSTDANHNIIIAPTSGDTLDGGASGFTINRNYEGLMVWSDGTEWYVIQSKNV